MPDFEYRIPLVITMDVRVSAETERDARDVADSALYALHDDPARVVSGGSVDGPVEILGIEALDWWLPTPWPHLVSDGGRWVGPDESWRFRDPYYNGEAVECREPVDTYVRGDFIVADVVRSGDPPGFGVITYSAGSGIAGPTFDTLDGARGYVSGLVI